MEAQSLSLSFGKEIGTTSSCCFYIGIVAMRFVSRSVPSRKFITGNEFGDTISCETRTFRL